MNQFPKLDMVVVVIFRYFVADLRTLEVYNIPFEYYHHQLVAPDRNRSAHMFPVFVNFRSDFENVEFDDDDMHKNTKRK